MGQFSRQDFYNEPISMIMGVDNSHVADDHAASLAAS